MANCAINLSWEYAHKMAAAVAGCDAIIKIENTSFMQQAACRQILERIHEYPVRALDWLKFSFPTVEYTQAKREGYEILDLPNFE